MRFSYTIKTRNKCQTENGVRHPLKFKIKCCNKKPDPFCGLGAFDETYSAKNMSRVSFKGSGFLPP